MKLTIEENEVSLWLVKQRGCVIQQALLWKDLKVKQQEAWLHSYIKMGQMINIFKTY